MDISFAPCAPCWALSGCADNGTRNGAVEMTNNLDASPGRGRGAMAPGCQSWGEDGVAVVLGCQSWGSGGVVAPGRWSSQGGGGAMARSLGCGSPGR